MTTSEVNRNLIWDYILAHNEINLSMIDLRVKYCFQMQIFYVKQKNYACDLGLVGRIILK